MNSEILPQYDAIYKVPSSKVKSITTNGGQYASEAITKAMDGDINTKWHSGKQNSDSFTNEVVIELNKLITLNRIVYTAPRGTNRGFAEAFDIYASRTTKGDTFELVSSGTSKATQDSIEINSILLSLEGLNLYLKRDTRIGLVLLSLVYILKMK